MIWGTKACMADAGHMIKMAAISVCDGKMILKPSSLVTVFYRVVASFMKLSNEDRGEVTS